VSLQAARRAAAETAAQMETRIRTKLVKCALKHGMTDAEGIDLAEMWKRAAGHTKHLPLGDLRKEN
jgi:hypothetical protein